jgi:hypothetical protein
MLRRTHGPARNAGVLHEMQIDGLRALALFVRLRLKAHPLPFVEIGKASAFHGGNMEEDIRAAAVRGDEAEPFVCIEKFHSSLLRHISLPDFPADALTGDYFLESAAKA